MQRRLCGEQEYPEPLLAVAGYRLPGAGWAFPTAALGDDAWTALLAGAGRHRLTGLLHAAAADGALPATPDQIRQARLTHRRIQMRVMALDQQLAQVTGLLSAAGVESRALKGSAVAHLDYPDPALRSYVDLDVLVRPDDIDRAVATLAAAGFRRTLAEPRPGFDRRFDKGMTLVPPAGYELDLHRTFVLGPWGLLVKLDQLWADGEPFEAAGQRMTALAREHRFVHACYHAALGDWPLRLGSLRDVAEIRRGLGEAAGPVRQLVRDWGVDAVVAAAVTDARRLLGLQTSDALAEWARGYRPTRRELGWLSLHTNPDKTFAAQALATLRVLPRWRDKGAYLRALILPDGDYVAGRHHSTFGRMRYALREIRRGRGTIRG